LHRALLLALLPASKAGCSQTEPQATPPDLATTETGCHPAEPALTDPARHTPRWAFEPWISKDISDTQDTYAFVRGFRERDIPVGTVVLDSPWETHYNTFVPSPTRYPGFAKLVSDMHGQGVRVILWITPLVNQTSFDLEPGGDSYAGPSPNYAEGVECGYFLNGAERFGWWKGLGAAVDFFNPRARTWWHRQQDPLLTVGIDGWKLDFGDSYIASDPVRTALGERSLQAYSEEYYRDFLLYGTSRRGKEFVTMVRGWDESYQFPGRFFARKEHAPVVWMGDNRRDYVGLADALDHTFRSARAGYVVLGSDIGGYLDLDDKDLIGTHIPFSQDVFVRWTAVGALSPFMQLHGRANITPWTVSERPDETVAIYRFWSKLHHQLVPFFYSLAEEAYAGRGALLSPQGEEKDWPGDYRYLLGEALLVAPILGSSGRRDVRLPAGADWYDFWELGGAARTGGTVVPSYDATDRKKIPLFVRSGTLIPMEIEDDSTGLGSAASAGKLTVLAFPGAAESRFALREADDSVTQLAMRPSGTAVESSLGRAVRPVLARVRRDAAPAAVKLGGVALPAQADRAALDTAAQGFFYERAAKALWIKLAASAAPLAVRIE
jgi:alpha-D-xyloside xylohydrolase